MSAHLRDQDVAHGQHAQAANLLGAVEHHGREAAGHLGVEADLDALQGAGGKGGWEAGYE